MHQQLLDELIPWAQAQPEILAVYLFGSAVEGRANALSDVDIGILVRLDLARPNLWELERQWSAQWPDNVDLCLVNLAPLSLRYAVTALGVRLWAAELDPVAEYESLIWREYWDLRPLLDQEWYAYEQTVTEQRDATERQQYQTALDKVRAVHHRVREAAVRSS